MATPGEKSATRLLNNRSIMQYAVGGAVRSRRAPSIASIMNHHSTPSDFLEDNERKIRIASLMCGVWVFGRRLSASLITSHTPASAIKFSVAPSSKHSCSRPICLRSIPRLCRKAPPRPEPRERPVLIGAGQPAVADDVGGEDRRDFSGFGHAEPPPLSRVAQRPGRFRLSQAEFWLLRTSGG